MAEILSWRNRARLPCCNSLLPLCLSQNSSRRLSFASQARIFSFRTPGPLQDNMAKPTLVQTLLNQPSQTYVNVVETKPKQEYYSTKQEMLRIAASAQAASEREREKELKSARTKHVEVTATVRHILLSHTGQIIRDGRFLSLILTLFPAEFTRFIDAGAHSVSISAFRVGRR